MDFNNLPVVIKGPDGKKILVVLSESNIDTHYGTVKVSEIRKLPISIKTSIDLQVQIYKPSYREFVLLMKRGAQIIYPKDVASIIVDGDILPGSVVLEVGSGSGALTTAIASRIGLDGYIFSIDKNKKNQYRALKTLKRYFDSLGINHINYEFINLDSSEINLNKLEREITHIVTDIPEPWTVAQSVKPTYTLKWISYLPNISQVQNLCGSLSESRYSNIYIKEILEREWKVSGNIVRPSHHMNGHTGFLVFADYFI